MIRFALYTSFTAILGSIAAFILMERLPEAAIVGALVGGCIGLIIYTSRNASTVSFEFESAGIADNNLITIARRNLVREAYRRSYSLNEREGETQRRAEGKSQAETPT